MLCPIDQTPLIMTDRYGVEIDYCPKCRGIWLDRGELDKIIDRAKAEYSFSHNAGQPAETPADQNRMPAPRYEHHGTPYEHKPKKKAKKKKKDGFFGDFLEEIFDF